MRSTRQTKMSGKIFYFAPMDKDSFNTVSAMEGFSIREYTRSKREGEVERCWPFDDGRVSEEIRNALPPITCKPSRWWKRELVYEEENVGQEVGNDNQQENGYEGANGDQEENMDQEEEDAEEGKGKQNICEENSKDDDNSKKSKMGRTRKLEDEDENAAAQEDEEEEGKGTENVCNENIKEVNKRRKKKLEDGDEKMVVETRGCNRELVGGEKKMVVETRGRKRRIVSEEEKMLVETRGRNRKVVGGEKKKLVETRGRKRRIVSEDEKMLVETRVIETRGRNRKVVGGEKKKLVETSRRKRKIVSEEEKMLVETRNRKIVGGEKKKPVETRGRKRKIVCVEEKMMVKTRGRNRKVVGGEKKKLVETRGRKDKIVSKEEKIVVETRGRKRKLVGGEQKMVVETRGRKRKLVGREHKMVVEVETKGRKKKIEGVKKDNVLVDKSFLSTVPNSHQTEVVLSADTTKPFITEEVFNTRDEVISWCKYVGMTAGMVVIIKRADNRKYKTPVIIFCCERSWKVQPKTNTSNQQTEEKLKKLTRTTKNFGRPTKKCGCPFRLQASKYKENDGWTVEVLCGTHNHALLVPPPKEKLTSFATDEMFKSRDELISWCKYAGMALGVVIFISDTKRKKAKLSFRCERGGKIKLYKKKVSEHPTGFIPTKKCGCPFLLRGKKNKETGYWTLRVVCTAHNHPLEKLNHLDRTSIGEEHLPSTTKLSLVHEKNFELGPLHELDPKIYDFIADLVDVPADGHCGFRAVAEGLGMSSMDGWMKVRKALMKEMTTHKQEYTKALYGEKGFKTSYECLNCFTEFARKENWMAIPEMGLMIASAFHVVFVYVSSQQCLSFFPLWTAPQEANNQVIAVALCEQSSHFVNLLWKQDGPIPPVARLWYSTKKPAATAWEPLYQLRMKEWKRRVTNPNIATTDVIID